MIPSPKVCKNGNGKSCILLFEHEDKYWCEFDLSEWLRKQVLPPDFCPIYSKNKNPMRLSKMNQDRFSTFGKHIGREASENPLDDETSCVTHECACGCGLPRAYRSKYHHKTHRDHLRNKCRIIAYQKLLEV